MPVNSGRAKSPYGHTCSVSVTQSNETSGLAVATSHVHVSKAIGIPTSILVSFVYYCAVFQHETTSALCLCTGVSCNEDQSLLLSHCVR